MKTLRITLALSLFVTSMLGALFVSAPKQVVAQQQNNNNQQSQQQQQEKTYKYVAQPGDSYSLMARKAIQTYGINEKVSLSEAQIIYAETNITKEAGSPVLTQGQTVEIKESTVKSWVDKAEDLTDEQEARWQPYAARANFNTNSVGQAS